MIQSAHERSACNPHRRQSCAADLPNRGIPGTVLRIERGKLAVLWADIGPDYVRLHSAASLRLA
jgi:hypothetical protein